MLPQFAINKKVSRSANNFYRGEHTVSKLKKMTKIKQKNATHANECI